MHSALQMKEIVRMICEHIHTIDMAITYPSLATFARVQKGMGSIALDILWRDISAHALLYLFPPEIVGVDERGKRVSLQPLCNNDWSRFNCYAPRIRVLRRMQNSPWMDHVVDFEYLLDILSLYRPCLHIIPNLEQIDWRSRPHELLKLTIFMGPRRIKHLRLTAMGSFYFPNRGVMPVLSALVNGHASLRTLRLKGISNAQLVPSNIDTILLDHLRQSPYLTKVTVQPSRAIMQALGTLQSLKTLTLASVKKTGCRGAACTSREISPFLEVATNTTHSCYLKTVVFNFPDKDELPYPSTNSPITLNDPRVFLSCRSLEIFQFINKFPLYFDDEDLKQLVSAWPNITVLNLCSYRSLRGVQRAALHSYITPLGLSYLSACPKLTILSLSFAVPNQECMQSIHPSKNPGSPLNVSSVGFSFLASDCIIAVACFLMEHFPKLNYIFSEREVNAPADWDLKDCTRWTEVNAGLRSLQAMAHRLREE